MVIDYEAKKIIARIAAYLLSISVCLFVVWLRLIGREERQRWHMTIVLNLRLMVCVSGRADEQDSFANQSDCQASRPLPAGQNPVRCTLCWAVVHCRGISINTLMSSSCVSFNPIKTRYFPSFPLAL